MFKCKHKHHGLVGETFTPNSIVGGDVELYWCPQCGAIGHILTWQGQIIWIKPGRKTICPGVPF